MLTHFNDFWGQKLTKCVSLGFETADPFYQFLGTETDRMCQFLAPEIVEMGQQSCWPQELTLWARNTL